MTHIFILIVSGYIGAISIALGYGVNKWQYWFVTIPFAFFVGSTLSKIL